MSLKCVPKFALTGLCLAACGLQHITSSGQTPPANRVVTATADLPSRLAAIEQEIEAKRKELHVPGASLVIVKDDRVIYVKGLGLRDTEHKLPVTPNTLFAIGSSSKAFTAMTVMMSVDQGKLALNAAPKKYLPYFKLRDPDADHLITLSDLLCHRSGLARTDLIWYPGVLNSEEVIRAIANVQPTAKLGKLFQYQNVMFLAAGMCVAKVQGAPWQAVVEKRIFKPLGMTSTETSAKAMQQMPDHSLGYDFDDAKKENTHLPMRDLTVIAPAGAINSNATDMAHWLRFLLDGGVYGGKRLVSQANFARLFQPHMKVGGAIDYGYGWFLRDWYGHKVMEHGGNIDGFTAEVALMPDQHLGFALLTNANDSPLGSVAMETIWSKLVSGAQPSVETAATPAADAAQEAGRYDLAGKLVVTVSLKDGKLKLDVPGQPTYTLANIGGRRYKFAEPPMPGFFATFRPVKAHPDKAELYLEQPEGKFTLPRLPDEAQGTAQAAPAADYTGPDKDLLGSYNEPKIHLTLEIAVRDGKPALIVPGQPVYPLVGKGKDLYALGSLPDTYGLQVKRDKTGKVIGIHLKQQQGDLDLQRKIDVQSAFTIDELMQKYIEALGGEENLRRHHSRIMHGTVTMENQGLTGQTVGYARAPGSQSSDVTVKALGKTLMTIREYCDGDHAGAETSLAAPKSTTGKALADIRISSRFTPELEWKTLYRSVSITGMDKVNGEEVYVVKYVPTDGNEFTDYISTHTFLLLKRDKLTTISALNVTLPSNETFSDYRTVDGVKIAFKSVENSPLMGIVVTTIRDITFDTPIDDAAFQAKSRQ